MDWTQRLRIRQLSVLVTLYESRSMTAAASAVGMSQPALSKWLAELEANLGAKLFARTTRGLHPTPVCDAFVIHARAVLGEMERSRSVVELLAQGAVASLAIGTTPPAATMLLPRAVHAFRAAHPKVHLFIQENTLETLLPLLRSGRLDFVVQRIDRPLLDASIRYDLLYQEEIRVVVGRKHPLARKRTVDWEAIGSASWIGPAPGSPLRGELEHELALAGQAPPRYEVETSSILVIVSLLQEGTLVGAMSARMAEYFHDAGQVAILPLAYQRRSGIGVLRLRDAPVTAHRKAFFEVLKQAGREMA
ncbi:MAG TPA: LysR family transcriptional regulator [Ramlibacter sp.]|jgi:DNA-binding transcriptional LysR family regulator|nr:LysR family transcriptional regulator [Ramlibacter sp.]